jgi:predicted house-cleaning noncanonical NTP pyrophosphatase (MazG superfamily)
MTGGAGSNIGLIPHTTVREWPNIGISADVVGCKTMGISLFPDLWRPPFVVLPTVTYSAWIAASLSIQTALLNEAAMQIEAHVKLWDVEWTSGLILRSSAVTETMADRGVHSSPRLARDFGREQIGEALHGMFTGFESSGSSDALAVIVQPLVRGHTGHLSCERRVSKTINHWQWEEGPPTNAAGRVNSQRDKPPALNQELRADGQRQLQRLFGAIGSWSNALGRGPAHLEWVYDGKRLWLLQLDFEAATPDVGVDPRDKLRQSDLSPPGALTPTSPFEMVDLVARSTWGKIANVGVLAQARSSPFPHLISLAGDRLEMARDAGYDLAGDLSIFGHDRIVCRTDCIAPGVKRENLPRTPTVSSTNAIEEMASFLQRLRSQGASAEEIRFILHKFIPAQAGAWAMADPANQIVVVDALWGVPDGLQYLPHDTFQYDIKQKSITAERLRFKPSFIQEAEDGSWQEIPIKRSLGRHRSLTSSDVRDVAETSALVAKNLGKPVLIMWFCGLPPELGIGRNLPWFRMNPNPDQGPAGKAVAPQWPKRSIRTVTDIEMLASENLRKHILVLEPNVDLIRDDKTFLDRIVSISKANQLPVEIAGSSLAHAYYILQKEGVSVIQADAGGPSRTRSRRTFDKLVRDDLPQQIEGHGELVVRSTIIRAEMRQALVAKLFEEAQELLAARDPDDVKSELADLLEVVRAAASATGTRWDDVIATADLKRSKRGGFETGAVLVETAWPSLSSKPGRAPLIVSLRSLAKVTSGPRDALVSFNALVSGDQKGVDVTIGGKSLRLQFSMTGLKISVRDISADSGAQLSLPLPS